MVDTKKRTASTIVLPHDVLLYVFSWLPVKSLLRFRCLSKRWLDVISNDSHFISLHANHSKSKPPLIFAIQEKDYGCDLHPMHYGIQCSSYNMEGKLLNIFEFGSREKAQARRCSRLLHTCFDLVCFETSDGLFHVCNPSSREIITLESPISNSDDDGKTSYGLGYIISMDEYKIVHSSTLVYDRHGLYHKPTTQEHEPTEFRVFTLGSSSHIWKRLPDFPYRVYHGGSPAFVEGALHWRINSKDKKILAFNVESEKYKLIPCPTECHHADLVVLRGLLCIASDSFHGQLQIWMLKDYQHFSWVKQYNIDVCIFSDPSKSNGIFTPIDIEEEDGDGNVKVLIKQQWPMAGKLFYYHFRTSSCSEFIEENRADYFSFYTESLRSLRHPNTQRKRGLKANDRACRRR